MMASAPTVARAAKASVSSLLRRLACRMTTTAAAVTLLLVGFFATRYLVDRPALRRATLQADTRMIVATLERGGDAATLAPYASHPAAYGFRVIDEANGAVLSAANVGLLAPPPGRASASPPTARTETKTSRAGVEVFETSGVRGEPDRWVLAHRVVLGDRLVWIEAAMLGDPAWRWISVIADELTDHVLLPVAVLVPALTLAMFVTIRHALRPLSRISGDTAALGRAVANGRSLTPLPVDGDLPREFATVIDAVNGLLAQLEQALSSQRQFTADAAHELRTPLAVILLEAVNLPEGPTTTRIRAELRRLSALLNGLLRLAQAEAAMRSRRQPVTVADCARVVCLDLARGALLQGKVIAFEGPPAGTGDDDRVAGHPDLIDSAIRNVVENAIRLSAPGSTVEVAACGNATVIVEDRGPGVPDAQKELIFARFWQADPHREGSGIGLAMVRRIAQLHGGEVRVEDREDGGARFILTLGPIEQERFGDRRGPSLGARVLPLTSHRRRAPARYHYKGDFDVLSA